jgi:hypothetical protein
MEELQEMTKVQFDRSVSDFKKMAKNKDIKVSFNDFTFLVLCSELEMYRILHNYNFGFIMDASDFSECWDKNNNISFNYGENLKSFYFMLEINFKGSFNNE